MGWFSNFFKGDKGGVEKTSTMTSEQQELMKKAVEFASGGVGKGLAPWGGNFAAPLSGYEQMGLDKLGEYMQSDIPETTQFGLGKYKEALAGMSPGATTDWYQQYIAPEEKRIFDEQILPGIKEAYVGPGTYWGSPRAGAEASAVQEFGTGQMSRIGEAIMSERESARGMLPYLGSMMELEEGAPLRRAQAGMELGAMPRQIEQAELLGQIDDFRRTQPELNPILDFVSQLLNTTTTAAYGKQGSSSPFASILSAVAPGVGSYFGAKS